MLAAVPGRCSSTPDPKNQEFQSTIEKDAPQSVKVRNSTRVSVSVEIRRKPERSTEEAPELPAGDVRSPAALFAAQYARGKVLPCVRGGGIREPEFPVRDAGRALLSHCISRQQCVPSLRRTTIHTGRRKSCPGRNCTWPTFLWFAGIHDIFLTSQADFHALGRGRHHQLPAAPPRPPRGRRPQRLPDAPISRQLDETRKVVAAESGSTGRALAPPPCNIPQA